MRNYRHLQGRTNPPLVKKKLGNEFESPVSARSCAEPWEERMTRAKVMVVSGATVVLRLTPGAVMGRIHSWVMGSECTGAGPPGTSASAQTRKQFCFLLMGFQ